MVFECVKAKRMGVAKWTGCEGTGGDESNIEIRLPLPSPKQQSTNSTSESGLQIIIPVLRVEIRGGDGGCVGKLESYETIAKTGAWANM